MTVSDFCETTSFYCIVESLLCIVPTIAFFILAYLSYTQAARRTSYIREWATKRHLTKLISSILLALICLNSGLVSLKTEITWGVSCFIWIVNSFLIRTEYKYMGYTSNNLKTAWAILWFCQTLLLILGATHYDYDNFAKVSVIYYLNEACIVFLCVYSVCYPDDFPPSKAEGIYDSILDNVQGDESFEYSTSRRTRSSFTDHFRPLGFDTEGRVFSKKDRKKYEQRLRESNQEVSIKGNIESLETISVTNHREITREGEKSTVIYLIEYSIKKKSFTTERSFNEFRVLSDEIIKIHKSIEFPPAPSKNAKKDDEAAILARKEFCDAFLKICLEKKIGYVYLGDFLQPTDILEYYGKDFVKQVQKKSFVGKGPIGTLKDGNQMYDVDCASAKPRGKALAIHYAIRIKNLANGGKETLVYKRYNDFRALHEELKRINGKAMIPELPYKGTFGLFAKESVVVEYRKQSLIEYLSTVLNTPGVQDTPYLLEFIRPPKEDEA